MEDLVCPECGGPLSEENLKHSLVCPNCRKNLRDPKYLDFLELLVYYDIVDDIDFFDMNLYGDEIIQEEREDYDEPDVDPSKYEKHKEVWDEFEDELEREENIQEESESDDVWNIVDGHLQLDEDDEGWDKDAENDKKS